MADKKITALTAATSAASEDLLHIIDDPGGSPVNKKLTVQNFLNSITHTSTGTATANTETLLSLTHTANADPVTTGTADQLDGVSSLIVTSTAAGGASGNLTYKRFYAADITNKIDDANTVIKTEAAGMRITMDRNAQDATSTANSHCLILRQANTSSAQSGPQPTSWLKIEAPDTSASANTLYVIDVMPEGAYGVSASATATIAANSTTTLADVTAGQTKSTTAGYLKVRVLGEDRYINLYSA